jgi:hypothetical protein
MLSRNILSPGEEELSAPYQLQARQIQAEEGAHLCPIPRVERRIRCPKLAQHLLWVIGVKANDRHSSPGRLGRKLHRLSRDTQPSPRLCVFLVTRIRNLLQKAPPGLLLIG